MDKCLVANQSKISVDACAKSFHSLEMLAPD